jgi:uncharacterized protein (TIGR02099 family)
MVKKSLLLFYRATLLTLWLIIIVLATSVLLLRYVVLPQIDQHKGEIAQHVSEAVGQKVTIGNIKAGWNGLNPRLTLNDVDVYDKQNRSALSLDNIETSLSWLSIPLLEPRLSELNIYQPSLTVRREADGTLYVAGIEMGGGESKPAFTNWLLRQSRVDIIDATVLWQDDMRQAPPLTLNKLNLKISSPPWGRLVGQHRFGLRATPSAGSSQPIDLRGNVYGHDVSQLNKWHGRIYGHMEGTDIAAWRSWVSYPFSLTEGFGAARFWLDFSNGAVDRITSDVVLNNVKTRLSKTSAEATFESLSGRLKFTRHDDGQELLAESIKISTADGLNMQNGKVNIRERLVAGKEQIEGNVELDEITLESANTFASYLPLPEKTLQQIAAIEPVGKLENLKLSWKGDSKLPEEYSISSAFSGLGMQAYNKIPGFSNLKGHIDADETDGTLTIDSQKVHLDLQPTLRWPIPADKLSAQIKWHNSDDAVDVRVTNLAIESPHLSGTVSGSYLHSDNNDDAINIVAKISRAEGKFAHFYYPTSLSEDTLQWLDTSIQAGQGKDANIVVKGKLAEFPWADSKNGLFQVKAKITDGVLDYATGWPKIEGIALDLLFQGNRMELNADKGRLFGSQIIKAQAVIPVLDAEHPVLEVNGEVDAPPAEAIKYINASPVLEAIDGFTEGMQGSGSGKLLLGLNIPLDAEGEGSKVKGSYTVKNGTLSGGDEFPALTNINGKLDFTETTVRAQKIAAQIYGGPAQFSLANGKDGQLRVVAQGRLTDQGIREATDSPLTEKLQGAADWNGEINIRKRQAELVISSTLVGLASTLPAPFNKAATDPLPLRVEKKMQGSQQAAGGDIIDLSIGNIISAKLLRTQQNGIMKMERGEISLGGKAGLPEQPGIRLKGDIQHLDVDQWLALLDDGNDTSGGAGSSNSQGTLNISGADMRFGTLDVFGRRINDLKLLAKATSDGWDMNLQSREINGSASWAGGGNGKIVARLKSLITPSAAPAKITNAEVAAKKDFKYPALDIIAEEFEITQKKLGRLEVQASEQNNNWHIQKLRISNPDSVLTGEGDWLSWNRNPSTRLNINWKITDVGGTLERFGYPNTVKGGEADFIGQLNWPGSPHQFDYPGLNGNFKIEARKGQILEIKPGVGRLFSVLSLQNLPRRLSFDFRDVFSSGFTFDKISANVKIDHGIMRSDDFILEGPTARVEMKGETDLKKETQHLFVKVTPYISDGLSLAALAGGPAVAAAAYLAQKLLKDPLNRLAVDRYEIVGTWDDPKEVKAEAKEKALTPSPLGDQ